MTATPPPLWTGKQVTALQDALRLTNEEFADVVKVSPRSVATWRAREEMIPRPGVQRLLDDIYLQAPIHVQDRFAILLGHVTREDVTEITSAIQRLSERIARFEARIAAAEAV